MSGTSFKHDEIGYWSEVKLDIIRKYASAFSTIIAKQRGLSSAYIDGFSGAGQHVRKDTGEPVPGSPINALNVEPPFDRYFLIDLNGRKVGHLRGLVGDRPEVEVFEGDCNRILVEQVLPQVQYRLYRRGLLLLDPYGLHLDWAVMAAAGASQAIDMFLNFPVMDMNMNVLRHRQETVSARDAARMTAFWGDETWKDIAYEESKQPDLFESEPAKEKVSNEVLAAAFRDRLRNVGGFAHVPEPIPMRNTRGATVYYLFFASQKPVASKVYTAIKTKYEGWGA